MQIDPAMTTMQNFSKPSRGHRDSNIISLGLENPSAPIPLKKKWEKCFGGETQVAFSGGSSRLYLVQKDRVLAVERGGNVAATFPVEKALTVGEGSHGKLYVASKDRKLRAFDASGNLLWAKECPKWRYTEYDSRLMYSSPVEGKDGKIWMVQGDLMNWGEYADSESKLLRFSPDGSSVESYAMDCLSVIPVTLDEKGNAYVIDSQHLKFSPDFEVKKLQHPAQHLFLIKDQPYSIVQNKMYRLDFSKSCPGPEDEILHWGEDKEALEPVVAKDGTVRVLLRCKNGGDKKGLCVTINPNGPAHHKVISRKEIPFAIDSGDIFTRPMLTPDGTLYFFGARSRVNEKMVYPVHALDSSGAFHTMNLESEPLGFHQGDGEEVIIPLKNGSAVCVEARSTLERMRENRIRMMDYETLTRIGSSRGILT